MFFVLVFALSLYSKKIAKRLQKKEEHNKIGRPKFNRKAGLFLKMKMFYFDTAQQLS